MENIFLQRTTIVRCLQFIFMIFKGPTLAHPFPYPLPTLNKKKAYILLPSTYTCFNLVWILVSICFLCESKT